MISVVSLVTRLAVEKLSIFENEKFGKVRVVAENEKPYFNLNDVCEILGLKNPRQVKSRLLREQR